MKAYIIEGPADAGNSFGFFKRGFVPVGGFILARKGEYANGGFGPSTVDGKLYKTREHAESALRAMEEAAHT